MENLNRKLDQYPKKVIDENELFRLLGCDTYESYCIKIQALVAEQLISPVRSSRLNGRNPALFNRYRILKPEKIDMVQLIAKIRGLHPRFSINSYLSDPEAFQKHKDILLPLSRFLWEKQQDLKQPMSINERSFAIFRDEKLLAREKHFVESILSYSGLHWDFLNCYDTPEPFFSWHLEGVDQPEGSVLVLENKDIWYTLVKLSEELRVKALFSENVVLLIYGEGNKITRTRDGLSEYLNRFYGKPFSTVYYAGDADTEGISIYQRLKCNQQSLPIKPFLPIYREMYAWAGNNRNDRGFDLPASHDSRNRDVDIEGFLMESAAYLLYNQVEICQLAEAIRDGGMIPQETVNRSVFLKLLKEEA